MTEAATREAALALARGDALRALSLIGREEGGSALTVRGIAYAQIGDLTLARECLAKAEPLLIDPVARARVRAAMVEVRLTEGDTASAARDAEANATELERLGDARNAAMQRLVLARAQVLLGRSIDARRTVDGVLSAPLAPDVRAVAALARAEIAIREIAPTRAEEALRDVRALLVETPHDLLARTADAIERELTTSVARILERGVVRAANLFAIEAATSGPLFLVDACRRLAIAGRATVPLAKRPVLFALLAQLARAWPESVPRDELIASAFGARRANDSHRARLRVEVGRLREVLRGVAEPLATREGYVLRTERDVAMLLPINDDDAARIEVLLADGASWSTRALSEHAAVSQRTVQRALVDLVASGRVVRTGSGSEVRYATAGARVASRLLLLGLVPTD